MPAVGETETQCEITISPLETGCFFDGIRIQIGIGSVHQSLVYGREYGQEPAMCQIKIVADFDGKDWHYGHFLVGGNTQAGEIIVDKVHAESQSRIDVKIRFGKWIPFHAHGCFAKAVLERTFTYMLLQTGIGIFLNPVAVVAVQIAAGKCHSEIACVGDLVQIVKFQTAAKAEVLLLPAVNESLVQHIHISVIVYGIETQLDTASDRRVFSRI